LVEPKAATANGLAPPITFVKRLENSVNGFVSLFLLFLLWLRVRTTSKTWHVSQLKKKRLDIEELGADRRPIKSQVIVRFDFFVDVLSIR